MFGFLKFLFFCALAIAAGVAAVTVPVGGKTVAAHVESWVGDSPGGEPGERTPQRKAPAPAPKAKVAASRPPAAPAPGAKPRQEESVPTPAERAALENLIGSRTARPPAQGR